MTNRYGRIVMIRAIVPRLYDEALGRMPSAQAPMASPYRRPPQKDGMPDTTIG
jgi:hypothetical protein